MLLKDTLKCVLKKYVFVLLVYLEKQNLFVFSDKWN